MTKRLIGPRLPKLYAEHIRLDQGGYDRRGRYWGHHKKLYLVSEADGDAFQYVRASSAKEAKTLFLAKVTVGGFRERDRSRRHARRDPSIPTVSLASYNRQALAKTYKGRLVAKTYANLAQANAAAAKLGAGWGVVGRRPYFVVRLRADEIAASRPSRAAVDRVVAAFRSRGYRTITRHARPAPRRARRDPGGPGKFIVKISNAPRYKGEYSGGATLAEAVVEARTFKATVGPRARIEVGYFTFGKNDPEDGRWHVSRTVQQGETSWL